METNILGLPSLTGYTPLKAAQEDQVLKYDFRGIGPIVVDKSGHENLGRSKPRRNPPRRKILSLFPLKMAMAFDGSNYIEVSDDPTLNISDYLTVSLRVRLKELPFSGWNCIFDRYDRKNGWDIIGRPSTNRIRLEVWKGGSNVWIDTPNLNEGKEYKIELTFNEDSGRMKGFLDGEKIDEKVAELGALSHKLYLAADDEGNPEFTGEVIEAHIYNRA